MLSTLTTHTHTQIKTKTRNQKYTRRYWERLVISITFIAVIVSWVFAYVQTH